VRTRGRGDPIPVSVLRDAVRRAVASSSLRAVGDAVGLSHKGITKFLAGSKPQASTMRNLTRWYLTESGASLDAETAAAAINLLASGFTGEERERVRAGLLDVLRDAHRAAGREPPEWLRQGG
jgi:hypothetical protein